MGRGSGGVVLAFGGGRAVGVDVVVMGGGARGWVGGEPGHCLSYCGLNVGVRVMYGRLGLGEIQPPRLLGFTAPP